MLSRMSVLLCVLLFCAPCVADTVAVIGTGNVGTALGTEIAKLGHTVIYGSRKPDGSKARGVAEKTEGNATTALPSVAAENADIVILAVPGNVVRDVVAGLGDLRGKIVIDATNPLIHDSRKGFSHGVSSSNGEIVQKAVPRAFVVKAFNTVAWPSMIHPEKSDGPVYVPLAGNHDFAKETVAAIAEGMGLVPFDLGPIGAAHWTEYGVAVWLNNRESDRSNYELVFRKID